MGQLTTVYSERFYDSLEETALVSARIIVPIVLRAVEVSSVIDFGCGRGAWLRAFQENGAGTVKGLDGDYVNRQKLLIPADCFQPVDLSKPFDVKGAYDLAVCLEVVEHLSPPAGRALVRQMTKISPLVLFSAAVPGQKGKGHVNEQWPSYWEALFAAGGFRLLDPIRRHIWYDRRVAWWYRQNIVLFASHRSIQASAALEAEVTTLAEPGIEWVHANIVARQSTVRSACADLPGRAWRAVRRRLLWGRRG